MKPFQIPVLLFAAPAALVAFAGSRTDWLIFDRTALANGELWRLWTGHWVHFSPSHVIWNLLVLLTAGAWLEKRQPGWLLRHTLVAAPLISLTLLVVEPAMQRYGGLSALATGTVTLLALAQMYSSRADRALWTGMLVLVAGKIVIDLGSTTALFGRFDDPTVRPSVFAHAAGAIIALALFPLWRRRDIRAATAQNKTARTQEEIPAAKFR